MKAMCLGFLTGFMIGDIVLKHYGWFFIDAAVFLFVLWLGSDASPPSGRGMPPLQPQD